MRAARVIFAALAVLRARVAHPPSTNPFCGLVTERNTVEVPLFCENGVIDSVTALFGTPAGACPGPFSAGACNDAAFPALATAACVGKRNCTLTTAGRPDPCGGVVKTVAAVAHCSLPPGGWAPPPPPPPTCALSGVCPPPTWAPTWNLTQSSVIQPSSASWFEPKHAWGLISLDWSVNRATWFRGNNRSNTTCEATSIENCRRLKAAGLAHRCFIYHNMELALEWLESQRAVMYDADKADYFLQYGWVNGQAHGNGTVYNEGRAEGDQFFWNYLNSKAADFFVSSVTASIADAAVDGTFTDDVDGLPAEHPAAQGRIGMSDDDLSALRFATQSTSQRLIDTLIAAGKYNWQAFGSHDTSVSARLGAGAGISPASCASDMRTLCNATAQAQPLLMKMASPGPDVNQTVAAFLIARPPYAYLGVRSLRSVPSAPATAPLTNPNTPTRAPRDSTPTVGVGERR